MRLIGALLTVAAFFLYGTSRAGEVKNTLAVTEGMLTLLRDLSRRLTHGKYPLGHVFSVMEDPLPERYGFLSALRSHDGRNYPAVWKASVLHLPLDKAAKDALLLLGDSLGRVSLEVQTEQIALCIAALEESRRDLRDGALQKQRSTVALWTLGGFLVALLLI